MAIITESTVTLKNIRDKIFFLTRESIKTFPSIDSVINDGVAIVNRIINREEPYEIYRTLVAGLAEYDLPNATLAGGNAIVQYAYVEYTDDSDEVQRVTLLETMFTPVDSNADTDTPASFYVSGDSIFITPAPDTGETYTLTVGYMKEPDILVNDNDYITGMTTEEIEAVVFHSCYILKLSDDEYNSADRWKQMFDESITRMTIVQPGVYTFEQLYGKQF